MYFPLSFGISLIVALTMLLLGHLYALYKLFDRTLKHSEKCGCCGKKEEEAPAEEAGAPTVGGVVDAVVEKFVG